MVWIYVEMERLQLFPAKSTINCFHYGWTLVSRSDFYGGVLGPFSGNFRILQNFGTKATSKESYTWRSWKRNSSFWECPEWNQSLAVNSGIWFEQWKVKSRLQLPSTICFEWMSRELKSYCSRTMIVNANCTRNTWQAVLEAVLIDSILFWCSNSLIFALFPELFRICRLKVVREELVASYSLFFSTIFR